MKALREVFTTQGVACSNLGSPFMGRLFDVLAEHWPDDTALAAKCETFSGDIGPAGVSLPLRIAGGLHALKLQGDKALADVYPPRNPGDDIFRDTILAALHTHDGFLADWINSPPQTNEIRRSAALIPAAHLAAAQFDLPIWLSELGASGGLNMMWDHVAVDANGWRIGPTDAVVTLRPDWDGPAPTAAHPVIVERRGVDLNPLDPTDQGDLLRMSAYLWPDQPERLVMTRASAGCVAAPVDQADAIAWLEQRLDTAPQGHLHLIQNTIAWQYFPDHLQDKGRGLFDAAGAKATPNRPIAWMQLETDGDQHGLGGAAITLQTWPGGEIQTLGRADFHGRWVRWTG